MSRKIRMNKFLKSLDFVVTENNATRQLVQNSINENETRYKQLLEETHRSLIRTNKKNYRSSYSFEKSKKFNESKLPQLKDRDFSTPKYTPASRYAVPMSAINFTPKLTEFNASRVSHISSYRPKVESVTDDTDKQKSDIELPPINIEVIGSN